MRVENIAMKKYQERESDQIYIPQILVLGTDEGETQYAALIAAHPEIRIHNLYALQKKELFKIRNPSRRLNDSDLDNLYNEWISGREPAHEGVWVYYPWLNKLVHTLSREEFIELRTNRNHYKISPEEQQQLLNKQVGIIGLSVGHAVAVCMATERICGKLKLADFDDIELSNLNRIKTSILNIGINKCISTAREIAELDPFLDVECYTDGINEDNLQAFLLEGGKLDILVDECDGLDIKIQCRQEAKKHKIPVVMETSDKGMLDVERYDLEEERPVLHGLLNGISFDKLKNLTNEEKIPLILRIADVKKGSLRGKVSMLEVGQSISTWPQLASAVTLGGAVVTDVCRRILLDQYNESGRYYIDIEALAGNTKPAPKLQGTANPHKPFDLEISAGLSDLIPVSGGLIKPSLQQVEQMVEAACLAPSTGNDQPWKWVYKDGQLFLFHDAHRSYSFGDFHHIASYISLGAAYENLLLKSNQLGFKIKASFFPSPANQRLVAAINFVDDHTAENFEQVYAPELAGMISTRCTNRNPSVATIIPGNEVQLLISAAESVDGSTLHCITKKEEILALGRIIGECDRIRLLNKEGHKDFVEREMRWTADEAHDRKDGIDIRTLGMSSPLMAALSIIKDGEVTDCLKKINGGKALVDAAMHTAGTSSFIGIITLPKYKKEDFFAGGIAMQRLWLQASQLGYAVHPLISPFYLFPRVFKGNGEGLDAQEIEKLKSFRQLFAKIIAIDDDAAEVFMFKLAKAAAPALKTLRLPLTETFFVINK
jgi:molybdopterin/thiamine biosynthesis adenylyltransferase/nitroreductase